MLKNDVKKKKKNSRIIIIKKKQQTKTQIGQKERENALSAHFFNNTIDITLPSPNKARDA